MGVGGKCGGGGDGDPGWGEGGRQNAFVKTHPTVHSKCMHFMVCKLHLSKVD